jgi:hypothetical protein
VTQETLFDNVVILDARRTYFGLGEHGLCKIGTTSRKSGRRGGELHFTELCSVPGGRSVEDYYHQKYATERQGKSEWFYLSDRLAFDLIVMCIEQGRPGSAETLKAIMLERLQAGRVAA